MKTLARGKGVSLVTAVQCNPPAHVMQPYSVCGQVNLTVYHQDRATAPPGIDNKNTGDAPGDAYFSLKDVGLAHECREDPRGFDCKLF